MASASRALDRLDVVALEGVESQVGSGPSERRQWFELVKRAALSNCTILITGETGSGKVHLARWMHGQSPRRRGPFVPVNCGPIPEAAMDSQLFGHVRGSFTGATADHLGLVRALIPSSPGPDADIAPSRTERSGSDLGDPDGPR